MVTFPELAPTWMKHPITKSLRCPFYWLWDLVSSPAAPLLVFESDNSNLILLQLIVEDCCKEGFPVLTCKPLDCFLQRERPCLGRDDRDAGIFLLHRWRPVWSKEIHISVFCSQKEGWKEQLWLNFPKVFAGKPGKCLSGEFKPPPVPYPRT